MPAKQKVLVIDDEEITLAMLASLSRKEGYEVLATSDAMEGMELALTEKPDLIVLDIYMPGRNGWSLLSQLRAEDKIANTPVIMLTSEDHAKSVELAYELGATSYLTKPIQPDRLKRKMAEALATKES